MFVSKYYFITIIIYCHHQYYYYYYYYYYYFDEYYFWLSSFNILADPLYLKAHKRFLRIIKIRPTNVTGLSPLFLFAGTLLHTLEEHIGVVRCLYLSGNRLVSGGDQKRIAVWDIKVRRTSN